MEELKISNEEWDTLQLKLLRKYNHLSDEDLAYQEGQEQELVARLSKRLRRDKNYGAVAYHLLTAQSLTTLFTLKKGLADLDSNRL